MEKSGFRGNELFLNWTKLDPMVERASDFQTERFQNVRVKHQGHGNKYSLWCVKLYEDDLKVMFQAGIDDNSNKINAGKMFEKLLVIYPD